MVTPTSTSVPSRPYRPNERYRVRPIQAALAGLLAGLVLLAAYYITLGMLPAAFAYPKTFYPVAAWAHRFDVAQFLGTIPFPPEPSPLTWWVGLAIWIGTLTACGVVYAVLLAWTLQPSDPIKGIGFGGALFGALSFLLSLAQGFHPAIMRNALPDVGLFLLGWSPWATAQLCLVFILYGATLGALYRRSGGRTKTGAEPE